MSKGAAIDQLSTVMRTFMAHAVLFQDAVARRAGLNSIDLQCLNLLVLNGPMTPGELAQQTGISAGGAITIVIDRLERSGLASRSRDQADRRKVIITPHTEEAWQRIGPLYEGVQRGWAEYLDTLTVEQIRFAQTLLRAASAINQAETKLIQQG